MVANHKVILLDYRRITMKVVPTVTTIIRSG